MSSSAPVPMVLYVCESPTHSRCGRSAIFVPDASAHSNASLTPHAPAARQQSINCVLLAQISCKSLISLRMSGSQPPTYCWSWRSLLRSISAYCRLDGGELFSFIQNKASNGDPFVESGCSHGVRLTGQRPETSCGRSAARSRFSTDWTLPTET